MSESEHSELSGATGPLDEILQRFAQRLEEGEVLDLDQFCQQYPAELRDQLREHCQDLIDLHAVLNRQSSGTGDQWKSRTLDDFTLEEEIGRGAMGVVYRARQISLDREVAVKVLPPHFLPTDRRVERFRREAKAAARLRHPAIVAVHEVGQADGLHYFAMDLIQGHSLHEELDRHSHGREPATRRLPPRESPDSIPAIARLIRRMAEALHYAHQHGIVHRDVKPHNILLDEEGQAYLADFGLAKDQSLGSMTRSGELAGTYYYMSPEQSLAKRVPIDFRTDIFSLGVVLYECLTLQRPFEGDTEHEILYKISFREPRPIQRLNPAVPRDLAAICDKAMAKDRRNRYGSAQEFAEDLGRFLNHQSTLAKPPTLLEHARRQIRQHRAISFGLALTLAVLAASWWWNHERLERRFVEERTAVLEEFLAEPVTTMDGSLASRAREVLGELHDHGFPAATADVVRDAELHLDAVTVHLTESGLADRELGMGQAEGNPFPSDPHYFRALVKLRDAARLRPEDAELARYASLEASFPRLTVRGPTGARVSVRPLLLMSGMPADPVPLGTVPLVDHPLAPGYYRVIVEQPGVGFCEMTRMLDLRGHSYELTAIVRPTAEVVADMVEIPAGSFLFGETPDGESVDYVREQRLDLPAFYIDRAEVSNGQYLDFLQAAGLAPPEGWLQSTPGWRELPVVLVNWYDVRAYAEWNGCRLPSHAEWERAACGTDGWLYPSGVEREDVIANLDGPPTTGWSDPSGRIPLYLQNARPVLSPCTLTPEGLYHVLGNVAEWTESLWVLNDQGTPRVAPYRVLKGGAWDANRIGTTLKSNTYQPTHFSTNDTGFRCAKSKEP